MTINISNKGLIQHQVDRLNLLSKDPKYDQKKIDALAKTFRDKNVKNKVTALDGSTNSTTIRDPSNTDPTQEDPGTAGTGDTYAAADEYLNGLLKDLAPVDLSGAPKVLSASDLAAQRQTTFDSLYHQNTAHLEEHRSREIEAQKQDLAERGIPLNFGGNDLYSRSVGDVNNRYDAQDQSAKDSANAGADARYATEVGANQTIHDSYVSDKNAEYKSKIDGILAGSTVLNTLMQKFHIDNATAQQILDRKSNEQINKNALNAKNSGGGGGGGGQRGGGGSSSGFNVSIGGDAP